MLSYTIVTGKVAGGGGGRNVNRLPPSGVGVRGESCKFCSIVHAGIVGII